MRPQFLLSRAGLKEMSARRDLRGRKQLNRGVRNGVYRKREHAARLWTLSGCSSHESLTPPNPLDISPHRDGLVPARKIWNGESHERTVAPEVPCPREHGGARSE